MQGLKIPWLKNRKGSIPFSGTNLRAVPSRSFRLRCTSRVFTYGVSAAVTALVTLVALLFAEEARCGEKVDFVTPAAIYSVGGAADWSASRYALHARPELREHNRFGLTGGVAFTSALFFGADVFLQKHAPPVWAKVLRWIYVTGVTALVGNSLFKAQGKTTMIF